MLDALAEWMGHPLHHTMHGGEQPVRTGLAHAVIAPYDAYPTADGDRVLLSVQNDREWRRLAEQVLERPELAEDPAYATNAARTRGREKTDAVVAEALGRLGADEAIGRLEAAGIACARLNSVAQLAGHPQLAARDRWGRWSHRPVRCGHCCRRSDCREARHRTWVRCLRSANTPRPCCAPWG